VHQIGGLLLRQARQVRLQLDHQTEARAVVALADADLGLNGSVRRQSDLVLRGDEFQRTQEAGRVAGREKLLRIGPLAARAAEFLRCGEANLQLSVVGSGDAFASAVG
jgi:hypothetical protein